MKHENNLLNNFFYPKSVAIVGASADPKKSGNALVKNYLDYGFKGEIYPINPKADEILGLKAYSSIRTVLRDIDLVVFAVPAKVVVKVIEDCASKNVKAVVVHSFGFAESGPEGKGYQDRLVAVARESNIKVVGPNCQGVMCVDSKLPWSRRSTFPEQAGHVSVISQSGGGGGSFVNLADVRGIKFSKIVTIGNECDASVMDFIQYFGDDPQTRTLFLFLEGFRDGERILDVVRPASVNMPIIAYKTGRTAVGAKAAASHTGSFAGSIEVYDGVFKQTGIIRAESLDDGLDYLVAFENLWFGDKQIQGYRVGIVSGPGGPGVAAADAMVESGLSVPPIAEASKQRLKEAIPGATAANPMDMGDFSLVGKLKEEGPYSSMSRIMSEDQNIDILVVIGPGEFNPEGFRDELYNIKRFCEKPLIVIWPSAGGNVETCKKELREADFALFDTQERGARALGAVKRYDSLRSRIKREVEGA
ncbi:CoA-binding protein [Desulfobacula sp.]|uniref:acetate--CoA ligase family protein n=1 Tax=Desulfobacula sp. TaxID=2593537 RepID=UPI002612DD35|nr:CoA-binding protein [Desulfobacula sp.]